jgi:hypothetical protein
VPSFVDFGRRTALIYRDVVLHAASEFDNFLPNCPFSWRWRGTLAESSSQV